MQRTLRNRLHEWLADRIRWCNTPLQPYVPAQPKRPFWRYQMLLRINLAFVHLEALIFSLVLPAALLPFGYFLGAGDFHDIGDSADATAEVHGK